MGTLRGANSYVNEASQIVSGRGMFAAGADTSIPDPNYPNSCVFCSSPFITHAFQWRNGVRSDLGALPGVNTSFAQWISDSGSSVGYSEDGLIDPLLGYPEVHAVLWKDRRIVDLGTLEGGYESIAFSINSKDQVVGVSQNLVPDPFFFLGTQNRTFLWQNGVMMDLGTLGGPDAGILGFEGNVEINERGQVIACSFTATINPMTGPAPESQPSLQPPAQTPHWQ